MNCRSVRTRAAAALGKLSALSTRVDPLVSDLLSMLQVVDVLSLVLLCLSKYRCKFKGYLSFSFFLFSVRR